MLKKHLLCGAIALAAFNPVFANTINTASQSSTLNVW